MTTLVICNMGKTQQPANKARDTYLAFNVGPPGSTSGAGSVSKKGRSANLRRMDFSSVPLLTDSFAQLQVLVRVYLYGSYQPNRIVLSIHISYYVVLIPHGQLLETKHN